MSDPSNSHAGLSCRHVLTAAPADPSGNFDNDQAKCFAALANQQRLETRLSCVLSASKKPVT